MVPRHSLDYHIVICLVLVFTHVLTGERLRKRESSPSVPGSDSHCQAAGGYENKILRSRFLGTSNHPLSNSGTQFGMVLVTAQGPINKERTVKCSISRVRCSLVPIRFRVTLRAARTCHMSGVTNFRPAISPKVET